MAVVGGKPINNLMPEPQEPVTQPDNKDYGFWEMAWDLRHDTQVYDLERKSFMPDNDFDLEVVSEDFGKQTEYVKNALLNAKPRSKEEYDYLTGKYQKLEKDIQAYSTEGLSFYGAYAMSTLFDPVGMTIGVATGGLGAGYKVFKGAKTALTADIVAGEAAMAGAAVVGNPTYSAEDALLDIAVSPIAALPIVGASALSPAARKARKNNKLFRDSLEQLSESVMEGSTPMTGISHTRLSENSVGDYQTANTLLGARFDRHAALVKSGVGKLSEAASKIYEDAVGMFGDKQGQGITVDLEVQKANDSMVLPYNEKMRGVMSELMKEQGVGYIKGIFHRNQVHKAYKESSKRIMRYKLGADVELSPAEKKMLDTESEAYGKALKRMQEAGVESVADLAHDANYFHIRYDKSAIEQLGKKNAISLFTRSFADGMADELDEFTQGFPEFLAKAMYHRIMKNKNGEAVRDFFDDPEEFFDYLDRNRQELIDGRVVPDAKALDELLGKHNDSQAKMFKRRAQLNRLASIDVGGSRVDLVDLMVSDSAANVQAYMRNAAGQSGLARGMGIKSLKDWQRWKDDIINQPEVNLKNIQPEVNRLLDDMDNVIFGRTSSNASGAAQQKVTNMTNYLSAVGLGFAGIASLPDLLVATLRSGVAASIRNAPPLKKVLGSDGMAEIAEQAASVDVMLAEPIWSSALQDMAEAGVEGVREGASAVAARELNRGVMRASGLNFITDWIQRASFYGSVPKLFNAAKKGKDFHLAKAETGWSNEEVAKLKKLLADTPSLARKQNFFDKVIGVPDIRNWSDADKELLFRGLYKYSLRAASRTTRGEQGQWQENLWVRVLAQFRGVVINSFTKRGISSLTRMHTSVGAKAGALSAIGQMYGLYAMYEIKAEAKMLGMSQESKNKYVKKLGFSSYLQYERLFDGSFEQRLETLMDMVGDGELNVLNQMLSYSPSHGSLMELVALVGGLAKMDLTGGRHRPVEDVVFGAPVLGYAENAMQLGVGMFDGEFNYEDANRARALMVAGNHPVMMYLSNSIIEGADLKKEKK